MNKLFLALCLTVISSIFAFAQKSDIKRAEFYVGYSNNQVETGNGNSNGTATFTTTGNSIQNFFDNRTSFNGFEVAGVASVSRFFGIKGDFSAAYRNKDFTSQSATIGTASTTFGFQSKNSLYNFLGGVQIKDNTSEAKIKPFAHALFGVGYGRSTINNLSCTDAVTGSDCSSLVTGNSDTGFASAFGGGLDVKLNKKINLRVIQVDYNPVHLNGRTFDNVRFGAGVNF